MIKNIIFIKIFLLISLITYGQQKENILLMEDNNVNLKIPSNCTNLIVRADISGNVIWFKGLDESNNILDDTKDSYIIYGYTKLKDNKIISNPNEYDYWFIDNQSIDNVEVFPNPTNRFINILFNNEINGDNIFYLYDYSGKLIIEKIINDNITLDFFDVPKGVYMYKINNNNENKKIGKIIII